MGLRILLIGPYPIQGKTIGGVEAVMASLAPALASLDQVSQVVVLRFRYGLSAPAIVNVSSKLRILSPYGQRRWALPTRSLLEKLQARRLAHALHADVVHGQGIGSSGDVATSCSHASVVTVHGLVHVEARMRSRGTFSDRVRIRLVESTVKDVLRRAGAVISTSDYDRQAVEKWVRGYCVQIPNPVSPEFFTLAGLSPMANRILFAGTLIRRKNVEGLIRAFSLVRYAVPEARLVIVGPSPDPVYAREVRRQVEQLKLQANVEFKGHVGSQELRQELGQAAVVTLFSREETLPTIIAQALAAGRPVIASQVGGIPEMVADGDNGFLVRSEDETALAERLVQLLRTPELGRHMGAQGHTLALERFDPLAVARKTLLAYDLTRQALRA